MFFENSISKLFSFNLFSTIDFEDRIITINEIIDKKKKFFNVNILLSLRLHRLKINNILFLNISKMTLCLFIYNFLKVKSYCFN